MRWIPAEVDGTPVARRCRKRENELANTPRCEDPIEQPVTTQSAPRGPRPAAIVVMGVSGSGKTTVGEALAARLSWEFVDGDSLHPPANVAKMRAGQPLDDHDRAPWLDAIAAQISSWIAHDMPGVITCSALKRRYRDRIIDGRRDVRLIYLSGSRDVIAGRLGARRGHFMPASLLDSQFATLEPPEPDEDAIAVDVGGSVEAIVDKIVTAVSSQPATMTVPT